MFPEGTHLLGDKAYPCLPSLIVPYKDNGHLTQAQRNFNYHLSVPRSTIERAFALLKKRFRCMKFLDVRSIAFIPIYILACCTLHNICILQNDILDYEFEADAVAQGGDPHAEDLPIQGLDRILRQQGQQKRDELCNAFLQNQ